MSQHNHPLNVECPQCHHLFDVEASLTAGIEARLKADLAQGKQKFLDDLAVTREQLEAREKKISEQEAGIKQAVEARVKQTQDAIKAEALKEASKATADELQLLRKKDEEREQELSGLKREKLSLLQERQALDRQREAMDLDVKTQVLEGRRAIEAEVRKAEEEKHRLTLREEQLKNERLLEDLEEAKRRADQGSVQLQGEAQERELREVLEDEFRFDHIEDVPNGTKGADVLQTVRDHMARLCGSITLESKRTKNFNEKWIEKLRADMQATRSEVGVIVTQTMPKDMPCMGFRDGVFVCNFAEVKGAVHLLRQALMRLAEVRAQEQHKEAKSTMLYAYFTSAEFKERMHTIVSGYTELQTQLNSEKNAMTRIWKAREKHIQRMLLSTTELEGAIIGIAGRTNETGLELLPEGIGVPKHVPSGDDAQQ